MITWFRRLLIRLGKVLPFFICALVLVAHAETLFALATNDFLEYDGYIIPNTPISFFIGLKFEYDFMVVLVTMIISIAIEACKWNIMATFYLMFHLLEKSYFDFELDVWAIYVIATINMAISFFFVYKGVRMALTQHTNT